MSSSLQIVNLIVKPNYSQVLIPVQAESKDHSSANTDNGYNKVRFKIGKLQIAQEVNTRSFFIFIIVDERHQPLLRIFLAFYQERLINIIIVLFPVHHSVHTLYLFFLILNLLSFHFYNTYTLYSKLILFTIERKTQ